MYTWRVAFVVALVAATALFLAPLDAPEADVAGFPSDKVGHVATFVALALLARRAHASRPLLIFAALVAYGALVELAQGALPWRRAEAWDLVADAAGALAAFAPRQG